jgi:hypothetical protein
MPSSDPSQCHAKHAVLRREFKFIQSGSRAQNLALFYLLDSTHPLFGKRLDIHVYQAIRLFSFGQEELFILR